MKSMDEIKLLERKEMIKEIIALRQNNGRTRNIMNEVKADFNLLHKRLIQLNKGLRNHILSRIIENIRTPSPSLNTKPDYTEEEEIVIEV